MIGSGWNFPITHNVRFYTHLWNQFRQIMLWGDCPAHTHTPLSMTFTGQIRHYLNYMCIYCTHVCFEQKQTSMALMVIEAWNNPITLLKTKRASQTHKKKTNNKLQFFLRVSCVLYLIGKQKTGWKSYGKFWLTCAQQQQQKLIQKPNTVNGKHWTSTYCKNKSLEERFSFSPSHM